MNPLIEIRVGSDSDLPRIEKAFAILEALEIPFSARVLSAGSADPKALGKARERAAALAPAVNVEDRRLAEFTDEEIGEILKQAGFRSLVPEAPPAAPHG